MTGAVMSRTLMTCEQEIRLPLSSLAVQVRTIWLTSGSLPAKLSKSFTADTPFTPMTN